MRIKMKENDTKGKLVTFCGLDGSGKTTLIHELKNSIDGDVFLTKQPTPAVRESAIFRQYMDNPDHSMYDYRSLSLLAASDRVQHSNQVILPEMKKGKFVISDRYFYSCLANLRARGFGEDTWIYEIASFIPCPHLSIFVDVPVEIAVSRVRERPEEKNRYIDMGLQYRLREEYLSIADDINGIVIDGTKSSEENGKIVRDLVKEWI